MQVYIGFNRALIDERMITTVTSTPHKAESIEVSFFAADQARRSATHRVYAVLGIIALGAAANGALYLAGIVGEYTLLPAIFIAAVVVYVALRLQR